MKAMDYRGPGRVRITEKPVTGYWSNSIYPVGDAYSASRVFTAIVTNLIRWLLPRERVLRKIAVAGAYHGCMCNLLVGGAEVGDAVSKVTENAPEFEYSIRYP